jgi:hypothetical protein
MSMSALEEVHLQQKSFNMELKTMYLKGTPLKLSQFNSLILKRIGWSLIYIQIKLAQRFSLLVATKLDTLLELRLYSILKTLVLFGSWSLLGAALSNNE